MKIFKRSLKETLDALNLLQPCLTARNSVLEHLHHQKEPPFGKFIISANMGGLCNRIKCLVSCMRLAEKLSRTVELTWGRNALCNCVFSDLFENKFIEPSLRVAEILTQRTFPGEPDKYFMINTWRLMTFPGEITGIPREVYPSPEGNSIDFEFERIPQGLRKEFLVHLDKLVPVSYIRDKVNDFAERFGDRTVSVSIRSWPEAKSRQELLFRLESVYSVLDREKDADFFVSCDSEDVLKKVIRRYGSRVIFFPKRSGTNNRATRTGMQDVLIDLLLLSRNKSIKASAYSTYSEMAWWFGGCKADVEILESRSDIRNFTKSERLDNYGNFIPADLLRRTASGLKQRRG